MNQDDLAAMRQNLTQEAATALATYNQAQGAIQLLDHLMAEMEAEDGPRDTIDPDTAAGSNGQAGDGNLPIVEWEGAEDSDRPADS